MSTTWVGTSWKMNKTLDQARQFARLVRSEATPGRWPGIQPFIIPPATAIAAVAQELGTGSPILVGAQNAHWEDSGPWTGEVSVPQVADAGAQLVEIGHSERREHFAETDQTVHLKVRATLRHGLRPLVCVGEPDEVFRAGRSVDHVLGQAEAALSGQSALDRVLVAYEPVWAIGESGRPARPEDVADVFDALRTEYGNRVGGLLYGGSVSLTNVADLLSVKGVDGLFIGRAAWDAPNFITILDTVSTLR